MKINKSSEETCYKRARMVQWVHMAASWWQFLHHWLLAVGMHFIQELRYLFSRSSQWKSYFFIKMVCSFFLCGWSDAILVMFLLPFSSFFYMWLCNIVPHQSRTQSLLAFWWAGPRLPKSQKTLGTRLVPHWNLILSLGCLRWENRFPISAPTPSNVFVWAVSAKKAVCLSASIKWGLMNVLN